MWACVCVFIYYVYGHILDKLKVRIFVFKHSDNYTNVFVINYSKLMYALL